MWTSHLSQNVFAVVVAVKTHILQGCNRAQVRKSRNETQPCEHRRSSSVEYALQMSVKLLTEVKCVLY